MHVAMATNGVASAVPETPDHPTVNQRGSDTEMATDGVTADGMRTTPHVDGRSPSNQNPTTIPQPATPSASSPITNLGNKNAPSITSPNQNRDSQGTTPAVDVAPTPVFAVRNAELECQWEVTKCTELRGTLQRSRNTINVYAYFKNVQLIIPR